jgi:hypothetical protein
MHLSFPMSRWFRSFRHSRRSDRMFRLSRWLLMFQMNPMFQMY